MRDAHFLVYIPDPFSLQRARFALSDGINVRILPAGELATVKEPIVTYDVPALVLELQRLGALPPKNLVDISDAIRLCLGRSKDDGGERYWRFWKRVKPHFQSPELYLRLYQIFESTALPDGDEELRLLLVNACRALMGLWGEVLELLRLRGEFQRFFDIEVPVRRIFAERQSMGISVKSETLLTLINDAKREKYSAYREIAKILNVSPSGMTFRNVGRYLPQTDAAHLAIYENHVLLEEYFKIASASSAFAASFLTYTAAGRDVVILTRLVGAADKVHLHFQTLGTVTGRIVASEPHIQQLRRKHRSIIAADSGCQLVYLDYAQFEPGIMASMSGDDHFISAYNSSDLYLTLSEEVFGDRKHRDVCKRIFLAFCYGMSKDRIAGVIAGSDVEQDVERFSNRVNSFFARYPALDAFRASLEVDLQENGFSASLLGNHRYRLGKGDLTKRERRWAVSQTVQGTASLIFKEVLIALNTEFGTQSVLLPMHDAVLMQFPLDRIETDAEHASDIMKSVLRNRCPRIEPKVVIGNFAS